MRDRRKVNGKPVGCPPIRDGKHLRQLRETLGWSVDDLARSTGRRDTTIRYWESGTRPFTASARARVEEAWSHVWTHLFAPAPASAANTTEGNDA